MISTSVTSARNCSAASADNLADALPQDTIIYLEIRFPKTVDVLSKPQTVVLDFSSAKGSYRVSANFMACRSDEASGDCFLSYVAEQQLPSGKFSVAADSNIEFEIHQRSGDALYSREEFFHTNRELERKTNRRSVLIKRSYECQVNSNVMLAPQALELYLTATAEPSKNCMQQAISIRDSGFWR